MTTHGWQFGVSDVANLPTSETDTGKVLAPDGSGGLTWVTASAGVTDHGALSGLVPDDDHTQYLLATGTRTGASSQRQTFTNAVNTSAFYEIGTTKMLHAPGTRNVFLGALTGAGTVTGADNIGIGVGALQLFGAGTGNMAIGSNSLNVMSAGGTYNVAIGPNAMDSVTVAVSNNIAIGRLALSSIQSNNNLALGVGAMQNATTTSNCIAIGNAALANETIPGLIAIGPNALTTSNGAYNNLAIGADAMRYTTTGGGNIAIGAYAMQNGTVGLVNVAIGYAALQTNGGASGCVAIGYNSMNANTTGAGGVGIGYNTLALNTTGAYNVAIAESALSKNVDGGYNVGIGFQSLLQNVSGDGNIGIGHTSLTNTTGDSNIAIGTQAMAVNGAGSSNVAIGTQALFLSNHYNNVAVGYGAGLVAGAHGCVYLGYFAGYPNTRDNTLFIENTTAATPLIYGEFDNDQVGINKAGPSATLHIASTATTRRVLILETAAGTPTANVLETRDSGANVQLSLAPNGRDWIFDTTTGTKHGTSTSEKQAWWGATPVVRPSAYTQTYSTADKTLSAYTSDPESSAYTGIDNAQGGTPYAQLTDLNTLRVAYDNLRVFSEDLAAFVNSLVDDMQTIGMVG